MWTAGDLALLTLESTISMTASHTSSGLLLKCHLVSFDFYPPALSPSTVLIFLLEIIYYLALAMCVSLFFACPRIKCGLHIWPVKAAEELSNIQSCCRTTECQAGRHAARSTAQGLLRRSLQRHGHWAGPTPVQADTGHRKLCPCCQSSSCHCHLLQKKYK